MEGTDRWFRVLIRVAIPALFLWMINSILVPVILGAILALLLQPLQLKLQNRSRLLARLSPLLLTVASLLVVVAPLSVAATQGVVSIQSFLAELSVQDVKGVQSSILHRASELLSALGISAARISSGITEVLQRAGTAIASFLQGLLSSLPNAVLNLFLFVVSLYFFIRDGEWMGRRLKAASPFNPVETEELFSSINATVRGAILGTIVSGTVQGLLVFLAFLLFGVPGAVLFGIVAAFLSLIPMVGTIPVTVGAILFLLINGRTGAAIGMSIAALIIGSSDNLVRPYVQSSGGKMHPLMALLGIFGGLAIFGPAGIFIGPVVAAMVLWALDYLVAYNSKVLKPGSTLEPPTGPSNHRSA